MRVVSTTVASSLTSSLSLQVALVCTAPVACGSLPGLVIPAGNRGGGGGGGEDKPEGAAASPSASCQVASPPAGTCGVTQEPGVPGARAGLINGRAWT